MTIENTAAAEAALERSFGDGIVQVHGEERNRLDRPAWATIPWSQGIGERVQDALDVESVLADVPDAEGIEDWIEKPILILGARKVTGEIDGRQSLYVVMDCADPATGERMVLTTGAEYVIHQLAKFYALEAFPVECKPYLQVLGRKGMKDPIHLGPVSRKATHTKGRGRRTASDDAANDDPPF